MKNLKIEKNIPYKPAVQNRTETNRIYKQLLEMGIGDSFSVGNNNKEKTEIYNAIKHCRHFLHNKDICFKGAKTEDGKFRFWKVS